MNEVLAFFKDFSGLINIVIVLAMVGLLYKLFQQTIASKDAKIALLTHQLEATKDFSIDHVTEKFRSLKEYYEVHLHQWYEESIRQLEEEKQKAIKSKEEELIQRLEEEMKKRERLREKYDSQVAEGRALRMRAEDVEVCGAYIVVGRNPYATEMNYFGELDVRNNGEVYDVTWNIARGTQCFNGIGLLNGTIFSVAFKEKSRPSREFKGVVVYEIITPEIMRGHWAAFDSTALGFEECRRK